MQDDKAETRTPPSLLARTENLLLVLTLAAMVLLSLGEALMRRFFQMGIPGSIDIVQHLVLYVGMLGSAVAAREQRLLSLSSLTQNLPGRWQSAARIVAGAFAVAIAMCLAAASIQFLIAKKGAGDYLGGLIPLWPALLILPVGFGLVALRLFLTSSDSWKGRLVSFGCALAFLTIGMQPFVSPERLMVPALLVLIAAVALGAPIFTGLGGAAVILFWGTGQPIAMVPANHYRLTVDATLPVIPLFTLVGYFLAEGNASRRLVTLFDIFFHRIRGGPAIATALVCALFTAFTGASGVTILALGGLLMPVLCSAGYSDRDALGLVTSAGSLGLLFPPSLPPILYAVVATQVGTDITIGNMFLGGVLPGILLLALTAWWGARAHKQKEMIPERFDAKAARTALWQAKWELMVPVIALVCLFGGFATPVEAAAVTVLYTLMIEVFIYRDLSLMSDVPKVVVECGLLVGGVLLILGVAMGFTDFLFTANVPEKMVDWTKQFIHAPWAFLLLLNLLLIVVGCLMDIYSAVVVVAPLIIPLGKEFGIDPVHLGVIFLTNLELGFLTPPVGINLFLSSYRFNKPMPEVIRSVLPMIGVLLAGLLLISYVPFLTTFLPGLIGAR